MWTQEEAIKFVTRIEQFCPQAGCHVALTGGTLYKTGTRKDVDIIFYRIRQKDKIDVKKLFHLLDSIMGVKVVKRHGWMYKATYRGNGVDILFPEHKSNNPYPKNSSPEDVEFEREKIFDGLINI